MATPSSTEQAIIYTGWVISANDTIKTTIKQHNTGI